MNRKVLYVGIGIVLLLGVAILVVALTSHPTFKGTVITPPYPAAEIKLTNQYGKPFTMGGQRGKVVLLYFGYTNCPDECPLTMAHLKLALERLGDSAKNVQVIMVSTDPTRDTPQALQDFMAKFNPAFLGLTGTPDDLQKVWSDYGIAVEDGGETHSTYLFVVDPNGNIRETFLPDSAPEDISADVSLLLKGN